MCLNGFLPVVSYAYEEEDNFYVVDCDLTFSFVLTQGYYDALNIPCIDGVYSLNNDFVSNIDYIAIFNNAESKQWTFPYNSEVYDYYFLGTMTGFTADKSYSTFKPTSVRIAGWDIDNQWSYFYDTTNTVIYDIDSNGKYGFGFYTKVNFTDNVGIQHIILGDDINGSGSKPANLQAEFGIMAVEKSSSQEAVLSQILSKLSQMESSITDSVNNAADSVKDSINNQYAVEENENFGVTDIVDQVNEKAGVLSFGTDTLVNFLDLFDAANATNTKLTFPGFSMKVQGVDYQVWPDYHYDLSELENQFGALIEVVRWSCVMVVWLAVLNYLVKAYDTIFGR